MGIRTLVKTIIPRGLFKKIEPWGHMGEAVVMQLLFRFPARGIKIIGVTGTNGKTTTCFMIHKMMVEAGYSAGLMTTVGWGVDSSINPQVEHMTTMPTRHLLKRIKKIKSQGAKWLVMEVTSHALAQNRVWGINYEMAVMTNVTHEHLDYHGTFDSYLDAKVKLFRSTAANKKGMGIGVINADDPVSKQFVKTVPKPITYGIKNGQYRAGSIKSTPSGSEFMVQSSGEKTDKLNIKLNIPGSFNVYNALAAAVTGLVLQMRPGQVEQGIAALESVEGRMNTVDVGQDFSVIVDYAHTPDSFEKLFADLRPLVKGKMIAMFGSAGRRDVAKRPIQGELAGKYCDEIIVTEEDDRDVDGDQILREIAKGAQKSGKKKDRDLFLIHDRKQAIEFTLSRARSGDTVLLLGKGHEKNIERADGIHLWNETQVAKDVLKKLVKK